MIAALPMYDRPELRGATDRFWAAVRDGLRRRGIAAPDKLTRGDDLWSIWLSPVLVLAQTCGLPYRTRLRAAVTLVATPDYALPGCSPGYYRSVVVARASLGAEAGASSGAESGAESGAKSGAKSGVVLGQDLGEDWRGLRLALNSATSQSGWAALANDWPENIPARVVVTGSHGASLLAVADGRADLAALDAQTWRQLQRFDPAAATVRVIAETTPTPGLPFITRAGQDPVPYRAALQDAIMALPPDDRGALGLAGLVTIPDDAYLAVPVPPPPPAAS